MSAGSGPRYVFRSFESSRHSSIHGHELVLAADRAHTRASVE
jgi:hypothetical protein